VELKSGGMVDLAFVLLFLPLINHPLPITLEFVSFVGCYHFMGIPVDNRRTAVATVNI
jgi:uncharacterized protein involved in cysteine biosynthesis